MIKKFKEREFMSRVLERTDIQNKLKTIKWEYISPEFLLVHEHHNFIFKNHNGEEIEFNFKEIWEWLYNPDYIGCHNNCKKCLTPIC